MKQLSFLPPVVDPADIVFTPHRVSKWIVNFLSPHGTCLDPCKGDGAFLKYLPEGSDYCEINDGKDFFDYYQKLDWIIVNPPYSIFEEFLRHSFSLAVNVSFLVPTNKIFQRQIIMDAITEYGGIKSIVIFGSGTLIEFPFGFSVGNFHFQKGYKGDCKIVMGMKQIFV